MQVIDLDKITETMQQVSGTALLTKYYNSLAIKCVAHPTPNQAEDEKLFAQIKARQKEIIGDAFEEFYTETTMSEWYIYLKRTPISFISEDKSHAENWLKIHQPNISNLYDVDDLN